MADFALIIFEAAENNDKPEGLMSGLLFKSGILKSSLCTRLFLFIKRKYVKACMKRAELRKDINVWIIKLPFTAARLTCFNSKAIRGNINRFCPVKGIRCFMSAVAATDAVFEDYRIRSDSRQIIYKAHLPYILDYIYESNGIRLGSLDTVIVAGQDRQELFHIVRRLEPRFRFLTIVAPEDTDAEAELSAISAESGLTISICGEGKSALKNAELIINLAGASALSKYRIKTRSLVLNFNSEPNERMQGENTVINGIDYLMSTDMFAGLGTEVLRHFSKKELTDVVMEMRLEHLSGETPDNNCVARVLEEFGNFGCRVTGYFGRRGVLKPENIIRSVRSQHMPGLG